MVPEEIESFVGKFRRLWHSGHDAQLTMSTKHGQAWISLNLGLGYSQPPPRQPRVSPPHYRPPPSSSHSFRSRNSPSRTRRRARRLVARETAPTDLVNETLQAASGEEAFTNVNETQQTPLKKKLSIILEKKKSKLLMIILKKFLTTTTISSKTELMLMSTMLMKQ